MDDLDWISDIVSDLEKYPHGDPVTINNVKIGMRVVRGRDWEWSDQDRHNGIKHIGTVVFLDSFNPRDGWEEDDEGDYWVTVRWDFDKKNYENGQKPRTNYRIGLEHFDLYINYL